MRAETTDDSAPQGERPTHPELLDYLACRFMADGWHPKSIQRLIVTSATYHRQSYAGRRPRLLEKEIRTNRACCPAGPYLSHGRGDAAG